MRKRADWVRRVKHKKKAGLEDFMRLESGPTAEALKEYVPPPPPVAPPLPMKEQMGAMYGRLPLNLDHYHNPAYLDLITTLSQTRLNWVKAENAARADIAKEEIDGWKKYIERRGEEMPEKFVI